MQVMFGSHVGTEIVSSKLSDAGERVYSSVTRDDKAKKLIIKVVNGTSESKPLAINVEGAKIKPAGKLITLSGKTPNATNSITDPKAIVPVERPLAVAGPKFKQTLTPYSVNVLELSY
jgi:alpha-N-arabinofuranosidase